MTPGQIILWTVLIIMVFIPLGITLLQVLLMCVIVLIRLAKGEYRGDEWKQVLAAEERKDRERLRSVSGNHSGRV